MLEVKNLDKKYGEHYAVNDLSFTVEDGQIYGFLGPNGAGKSTTMNIITGYIGSTSGTVLIDGIDITEEPEKAKSLIGYLPEIPPLYTAMEVEKYLLFAAELKRVPKEKIKEQVERVIELTNLTSMRRRMIANLSKGYRQRVGLAQAILGSPKLIILDEPTVGLDPMQIIEIRNLVKELSKEHTVILSSHILSEIEAVCDHVLIINKGKLVLCDSLENIEKGFMGKKRIRLITTAERQKVLELLKEIPEIESAEYAVDSESNLEVTLIYPKDSDIREKLFRVFSENNCVILEMNVTESSLEKVFLQTTGNGNKEQIYESDF